MNDDVQILAGICPSTRRCCSVGMLSTENLLQMINEGLIVMRTTAARGRALFGKEVSDLFALALSQEQPSVQQGDATPEVVAAMQLADEVSPDPARAHAALQVLKHEVYYRWQQRTALSLRLQDLRSQLLADGTLNDESPLYQALHDVAATAEGWMHPDTLTQAARAHLDALKARVIELEGKIESDKATFWGRAVQCRQVLNLISDERLRQISEECWTPEHDDVHRDGALGVAAACYAMPPNRLVRRIRPPDEAGVPVAWPWHPAWLKPKDRVRDLVRAGALIVAEIERIQRMEQTDG